MLAIIYAQVTTKDVTPEGVIKAREEMNEIFKSVVDKENNNDGDGPQIITT
ncbi:MAG: hypothetical protein ABI855_19235 [Bacteroidota bacterium]